MFGHTRGAFTGAVGARRGRFALAGRGTVFLDEIGDTSLEFQSKLLRVLQEREFYPVGAEHPEKTEARVIAATHRDLERLVAEGRFREDVYYRLRIVEIVVPPLRERAGDIPELAHFLVRRAAASSGYTEPVIGDDAMASLVAHEWRGNVRELENCLTRATVLAAGNVIRSDHLNLSTEAERVSAKLASLDEVERDQIVRVLAYTAGRNGGGEDPRGLAAATRSPVGQASRRMNWARLTRSLQAKLLAAVVVCALVPLAAVGMWLSSSAVRSGELLLRTQLDSAASRSAAIVQHRWGIRKSDVIMLATSAPVRLSLGTRGADTVPAYVRRAFATMGGISRVALRDSAGRVLWSFPEPRVDPAGDPRRVEIGSNEPSSTVLRAPVVDDVGHPLGEIEAYVRFDALTPMLPTVEAAPSQFIAYRDRDTGAQIAPAGAARKRVQRRAL